MKSAETETATPLAAEIIDRGRGPEIKGTRITVYSILDCALECWPPERIAKWFDLTRAQVEAAIVYIREHTREVLTDYVKILEREEQRNPPEAQAARSASLEGLRSVAREIQEVKARADADIDRLIQGYRARRAKEHADAGNHAGQ
jgi:uncharacterized protein (DUF433 family)